MSNLMMMRTFEAVSVVLYLGVLLWIWRTRNPLYLGAYLGGTTVYGFDWMWCTSGFFNATFNPDLIPMWGINVMGVTEPFAIPLNYALGFGLVAILLVRAKDWFDRTMGVWHYLAVWLYRIARNKVYDGFRRKERFVRLPEEEIPVSGSDEPVFDANDAEKLHMAMGKLKPYHREVLTLCFIEQMSYQSIADVVGCSIGTVRSRIFYAKQSLREEMERQNG